MYSASYESKYFVKNENLIGKEAIETAKQTILINNPVGSIMGYYDENLTILSVDEFLLSCLNYDGKEFFEKTEGSLKKLCCGSSRYWMDTKLFAKMHGMNEGQVLTADGTPIAVRVYKRDSVDTLGKPIWILAMRINWDHENFMLVNEAIQSGPWYIDCDAQGNMENVNWSDAFRNMLGYHDIIDFPNKLASWANLLHKDDYAKTMSALKDCIYDRTNNTKYNVDYRLRVKDGSYHWFRAIGEVIRRSDGTARRIAGVFLNIDKEMHTMQEMRKSDAFHRAFTQANLCEYYVDLENNTFETFKVENSLLTIFEKSNTWDELIEEFVTHYVCENDKNDVREFYNRERIARKMKKNSAELSLECQVMMDGQIRWMRNVVMSGEVNGTKYAMIFLRDITETKKEQLAYQKLVDDKTAMGHLIKSMAQLVDHFAICDLKNESYEYHNFKLEQNYQAFGTYEKFTKYFTDGFEMLSSSEKLEEMISIETIRKHLLTESDIYKFEYASKDGNTFRMASFIPLEWDGDVLVKVLWVGLDITEQQKMEIAARKTLKDALVSAEQANKAKTEFLTNMSHDIRTPMNAIVGLTALAGSDIDNTERVTSCLEKIAGSSRHLLRLINEVLDMAKIESGKITLSDEDFTIPDLVENLIHISKPGIEKHGHEFNVTVKEIEHEEVCGDCLRIQQIFTNLMGNAIKYTPDGGNIRFSIEEKPNGFSELGCFEFVIEDNGIGMTKEFQKTIFDPFTRADDHRTTNIQGTGLGMAITKNIVNMMNGDIKVESVLNKGTKITVTIYLKLRKNSVDKLDGLIDLPILVVDDDEASCESAVVTLEKIGLSGEWVTSGEKAIEKTLERHERKEDYFAILMDWQMPGMDGIETTRQIRKHVGKDVTIIVLTAFDYSEIEEEARAAGVDAFIEKPLFPSRLTATLKNLAHGDYSYDSSMADSLAPIEESDYANKRILLVEDNDLNREITAEILKKTNVEIDCAVNGKEAFEKVVCSKEDTYDLILMDIQMPVMNGYEATAAIRGLQGSKRKIPIIALTANAFAEDVQLAKNAGMNGHLSKPLEFDKLNDVLKQWLNS